MKYSNITLYVHLKCHLNNYKTRKNGSKRNVFIESGLKQANKPFTILLIFFTLS